MEIFDNLAKAAKDFFVEPDAEAPKPANTPAVPFASPLPGSAGQFSAPIVVQAEQRHLDHIASLLAGDGKDFVAYLKMVKSLAAAGMSGPLLYQTAFNAFTAVNGSTIPALLTSANHFEESLTTDRERVLARHREKMGEVPSSGAPSSVGQLAAQEQQLAADLANLTKQLQAKQQQLVETQQKLAEERQKTQAALASYELAQSTALAELQAHHKAAEAFLLSSTVPK
jgi:hypothetical protein